MKAPPRSANEAIGPRLTRHSRPAVYNPKEVPTLRPDQWAKMDTHERLTHLAGRSLDECLVILDTPLEGASNTMLQAKVSVIRAVLHTCTRLGVEASRSNTERERILADMAADLRRTGPRPNGDDRTGRLPGTSG